MTQSLIPEGGQWVTDISPFFLSDGSNVGTWSIAIDTAQAWNATLKNTSVAQNDLFDIPNVNLGAGIYTFEIYVETGAGSGILTLLIDGASAGTIDLYAASGARNTVKQITGISIPWAGAHHVQLKMATKNASSTGYGATISAIRFVRTA